MLLDVQQRLYDYRCIVPAPSPSNKACSGSLCSTWRAEWIAKTALTNWVANCHHPTNLCAQSRMLAVLCVLTHQAYVWGVRHAFIVNSMPLMHARQEQCMYTVLLETNRPDSKESLATIHVPCQQWIVLLNLDNPSKLHTTAPALDGSLCG